MTTVRIIAVDDRSLETSRAELVDGTVRYSGSEMASIVVAQRMRDHAVTEVEAVEQLAQVGWSNGYLMVELPPRAP